MTEFDDDDDDDDDDQLYLCVDVFYLIKLLHLILQSHRHFVKNKSMYTDKLKCKKNFNGWTLNM